MPATAPSAPGADRERRALGGAEPGHHQDLFAARVDRHVAQLVPEALAQPRRGVEQQLQRLKKCARNAASASQVRHQHLVAARHVEVGRRRDLAQVADRRAECRPASACRRRCRACRRCRARCRSCGCRRTVWFHGSQSQSTGGSSARNGITARIISWFEQSIRCVLMTPFGRPVEPEVKRILATVSPVTRRVRRVDVGRRARRRAGSRTVWPRWPRGGRRRADDLDAAAAPRRASARSKASPSAANTRPGLHRSNT